MYLCTVVFAVRAKHLVSWATTVGYTSWSWNWTLYQVRGLLTYLLTRRKAAEWGGRCTGDVVPVLPAMQADAKRNDFCCPQCLRRAHSYANRAAEPFARRGPPRERAFR